MRLVIQRVKSAKLCVENKLISEIGVGLMVFLGVMKTDTEEHIKRAINKISTIRIFKENGKINKSVKDVDGQVLLISNFTLCTGSGTGTRPDFSMSMEKDKANEYYLKVARGLNELNIPTKTGVFGADMQIDAHLDGPLTIFKEL